MPSQRSYSGSNFGYRSGPGLVTPAVKILIAINVVAFVPQMIAPQLTELFGLRPRDVRGSLYVGNRSRTCSCTAGSATSCSTCCRSGCSASSWSACGARRSSRYYLVCRCRRRDHDDSCAASCPAHVGNQIYYALTIGASGADFRDSARVGDVLSRAPDPVLLPVPDPGALLRDDHRRHLAVLCDRRAAAAAWRTSRTSVDCWRAGCICRGAPRAAVGGDSVPVRAVADQSRAAASSTCTPAAADDKPRYH